MLEPITKTFREPFWKHFYHVKAKKCLHEPKKDQTMGNNKEPAGFEDLLYTLRNPRYNVKVAMKEKS